MLIRAFLCVLALVSGNADAQEAQQEQSALFIVSEAWEGATNEDGSGFYWDLVRKIYEPLGYQVTVRAVPYARAVSMVKQEQADAWLGAYLHEEEFPIYPRQFYDADRVSALIDVEKFPQWNGKKSLENKTIGWINQYQYQDYLGIPVNHYALTSRRSGVLMLERGRLDAVLDADTDLAIEIEKVGLDAGRFQKRFVMDLPLYPAFVNTPRGENLAQLWDQRLRQLHDSGELQPFYVAAEYTEIYPFAPPPKTP